MTDSQDCEDHPLKMTPAMVNQKCIKNMDTFENKQNNVTIDENFNQFIYTGPNLGRARNHQIISRYIISFYRN